MQNDYSVSNIVEIRNMGKTEDIWFHRAWRNQDFPMASPGGIYDIEMLVSGSVSKNAEGPIFFSLQRSHPSVPRPIEHKLGKTDILTVQIFHRTFYK